jgi:hypothetical protein
MDADGLGHDPLAQLVVFVLAGEALGEEVGRKVSTGGGSWESGPVPATTGNVASSSQPAKKSVNRTTNRGLSLSNSDSHSSNRMDRTALI